MAININQTYQNKNDDSIYRIVRIDYVKKPVGRKVEVSKDDIITIRPIQSKTTSKDVTQQRHHFEAVMKYGYWIILTS